MNRHEVDVGLNPRERIHDRVSSFSTTGNDVQVEEAEIRRVLLLEPIEVVRSDDDDRLGNVGAPRKCFD